MAELDGPSGPIPPSRMEQIASEACESTFASVSAYSHPETPAWNTTIINATLQSFISVTSSPSEPSPYKFAVTSTIIQRITSSSSSDETTKDASRQRGMHSATGAYWNNEKDGMWSFKYEKGAEKGFDVLISVIWISVA